MVNNRVRRGVVEGKGGGTGTAGENGEEAGCASLGQALGTFDAICVFFLLYESMILSCDKPHVFVLVQWRCCVSAGFTSHPHEQDPNWRLHDKFHNLS